MLYLSDIELEKVGSRMDRERRNFETKKNEVRTGVGGMEER